MENDLYSNFINDFSNVMCEVADGMQYSNILFVCIGTDRITGDSFGPLVGYKLNSIFSNATKIDVIGDLSNPVNANNATEIANQIIEQYQNPLIIAVDSALSTPNTVGTIVVREGGVDIRERVKQKMHTYWRY